MAENMKQEKLSGFCRTFFDLYEIDKNMCADQLIGELVKLRNKISGCLLIKDTTDFVYLIQESDEAVKIGLSQTPVKRLAALQAANYRSLFIKYLIPCKNTKTSYELEKKLHNMFSDHRITGEWFKTDVLKSEKLRHFDLIDYENIHHYVMYSQLFDYVDPSLFIDMHRLKNSFERTLLIQIDREIEHIRFLGE